MRVSGNSKPEFLIAARTRSRDSRTAVSGRPTTENDGRPSFGDVDLDAHVEGLDAEEGEGVDPRDHRRRR